MRHRNDRREFLKASAAALGVGLTAFPVSAASPAAEPAAPTVLRRSTEPCVVSSANGYPRATGKAMELLLAGKDPLDAVVAGVTIIENDPEDLSVGLGGLPNENGVVELDASVMHGASGLSGAVGALQNIKNAAQVAKLVMETTKHALIVGAGALAFAKANGFPEENLLTDRARRIWLYWKQSHSEKDNWLTPNLAAVPDDVKKFFGITGTINCNAVDAKGDLAGVTTTSGLAFKIPGRVGDSPIIGAGLFVDNAAGAAGSTGLGEVNIVTCASHLIVEQLRRGAHPKDACLEACRRVVEFTRVKHRLGADGKPAFDVNYYCVDKAGRHGGAALYPGAHYSVFDAKGHRLEACANLLTR